MKPMLCANYDETKLRFPCGVQVKIDGVRGLNMFGNLTGRSLKSFKNKHSTAFFSRPEYVGIDGELVAAGLNNPKLCMLTSSATGTILGTPFLLWYAFDYLIPETIGLPYRERHLALLSYVDKMQKAGFCGHLRVVPMAIAHSIEEVRALHDRHLAIGYEGTIIRDLQGKHKQGRSTVREMGLLRIKDFIEEEFLISGITEGNRNDNVAQTNELGKTFRTSHQENKVPNGQVGSFQGTIVKDSDLFKKGQEITVAPGALTEAECIAGFNDPNIYIGKIGVFKHFPLGVKDKPRFPQFQHLRNPEDM